MKEVIVHVGPRVTIHDVPIPEPGADDVLIKVIVSGTNPKDHKMAQWGQGDKNSGDEIAGFMHCVGSNVTEFHPGDRVAAMHSVVILLAPALPHEKIREDSTGRSLTGISR
jgi:NADPH:quinone reductase